MLVLLEVLLLDFVHRVLLGEFQVRVHLLQDAGVVAAAYLERNALEVHMGAGAALRGRHTQLQVTVGVLEETVVVALHALRRAVPTHERGDASTLLHDLDVLLGDVLAVVARHSGWRQSKAQFAGIVRKDLRAANGPQVIDTCSILLVCLGVVENGLEILKGHARNDLGVAKAAVDDETTPALTDSCPCCPRRCTRRSTGCQQSFHRSVHKRRQAHATFGRTDIQNVFVEIV